ncbi:protein TolQ [Opitutales bacterium ASA1]|uniref:MotA/TolQ/ExbB proton channel family protein n=1 Tax=Congregicoccus parvus TaxID=3081749 RepID=UPI002B30C189|nr:protein TolQ [Opitutales bacterium ASA1]
MPFASSLPILAQTTGAEPGLVTYFTQSNLAGQIIIFALALFSLVAWTIMFGKTFELRKLRTLNLGFQEKLREQRSILDLPDGFRVPEGVPYAELFRDAVEAYWRVEGRRGDGDDRLIAARIEHAENALQRAVANQSLEYESNMVFLATIVSGAPFFGLLGTVWGVMDAFGAVALRAEASIQMLAPGVSGALLTTVAGLLVAIPSVFGYNYLLSNTKQLITELENFASSLADRIELESR